MDWAKIQGQKSYAIKSMDKTCNLITWKNWLCYVGIYITERSHTAFDCHFPLIEVFNRCLSETLLAVQSMVIFDGNQFPSKGWSNRSELPGPGPTMPSWLYRQYSLALWCSPERTQIGNLSGAFRHSIKFRYTSVYRPKVHVWLLH